MKRIIILSFLVFSSFVTSENVFAEVYTGAGESLMIDGNTTPPNNTSNTSSSPSARGGSSGGSTTVTVTEKIPGMVCEGADNQPIETRKYICTIQPGFGSVMLILKGLIKYTTFLVALIGVLMLVVSGVQYSMSGADDGAAKDAKTRIQKVLAGIVLLFLIGFILNSVAPWVYR